MKYALLIGSVIGCLGLAGAAHAQSTSTSNATSLGYYVRADGGISFSHRVNGDLNSVQAGVGGGFGGDLGTSGVFQLGGGVTVPNLPVRVDLTASYRPSFRVRGSATDPSGNALSAAANVDQWTVLANAYYDISLGWPVTPYVGLGLGIAHNHLGSTSYAVNGVGTGSESGHSSDRFAWAAMAGVAVPVANGLTVDLGYRYLDAGMAATSGSFTDTRGGTFANPQVNAHIVAHELTVGVRYGF